MNQERRDNFISIVTVHYNDFPGLEHTLASVEAIKSSLSSISIQWVVIDGGSDFSNYADLYNNLSLVADYFISEKDGGIYDAMNKGIAASEGDWVVFMNAGDFFVPGCFSCDLLGFLSLASDCSMVLCASYEGTVDSDWNLKKARSMKTLWWGMPTHHQAIFFNKKKLKDFRYDLKYKIASDYDLVCRSYMQIPKVFIHSDPLCHFDLTGVSSKNFMKGLFEQQRIRSMVLRMGIFSRVLVFSIKVIARKFREIFPAFYRSLRYK